MISLQQIVITLKAESRLFRMEYTCDIKIHKPIDEVISLFDNPENMKEWQPGAFKKQTMKYLVYFKEFAERQ